MSIDIKDLYELLKNVAKSVENTNQEVKALRQELSADIQILKEKNSSLEKEVENLKVVIQGLERKAKKYNIILYGLKESQENLLKVAIGIFQQIKADCSDSDIRDIYRIGKSEQYKIRPVVIELLYYRKKVHILNKLHENSKQLKEKGIHFAEDLIPADYNKRKDLYHHLKQARAKGYNASIKKNVLIVNGEKYTHEQLGNYPGIEENVPPIDFALNKTIHRRNSSAPASPLILDQATETNEKKRKLEHVDVLDPKYKLRNRIVTDNNNPE